MHGSISVAPVRLDVLLSSCTKRTRSTWDDHSSLLLTSPHPIVHHLSKVIRSDCQESNQRRIPPPHPSFQAPKKKDKKHPPKHPANHHAFHSDLCRRRRSGPGRLGRRHPPRRRRLQLCYRMGLLVRHVSTNLPTHRETRSPLLKKPAADPCPPVL